MQVCTSAHLLICTSADLILSAHLHICLSAYHQNICTSLHHLFMQLCTYSPSAAHLQHLCASTSAIALHLLYNPKPLHPICITPSAPALHHNHLCTTTSAPPLHLFCTASSASPLHRLLCLCPSTPLHLFCTFITSAHQQSSATLHLCNSSAPLHDSTPAHLLLCFSASLLLCNSITL